jgi:hypothetical protein
VAYCKFCGWAILWERNGEKWLPLDARDGGDHRPVCTGMPSRDEQTHEKRVGRFLKAKRPKPPGESRATWTGESNGLSRPSTCTHVWCGEIPPWDESLGQFRDFTLEEKARGEVCRPL